MRQCFALIRYHGDMFIDWDQTDVELRNSGRVHCEPGWSLSPVWASKLMDHDLWFISEGRGRMILHDGEIELRPGVCIWMRPGGRYEATQDPQDRLTVSFIHFELFEKGTKKVRRLDQPLPPEVLTVTQAHMVDTLLKRITSGSVVPVTASDDHRRNRRKAASTLFRGLLMDLDADSAALPQSAKGTDRHHHQLIEQAAFRIREHPGAMHDVAEMAARAGYSPDHFSRLFKRIMGIGPQAYVIRTRVDRARQLLVESSLNISQIADALGYEDVYFFSRQFKASTGQSPGAYRRSGR